MSAAGHSTSAGYRWPSITSTPARPMPRGHAIPTSGAPACGWIHDLVNRGPDGLWALVEWLDDAGAQIRAGKYATFRRP